MSIRWRGASARSTRIVVRDDRWIGANTDVDGFLAPLAGRIALRRRARDRARRRRRGARPSRWRCRTAARTSPSRRGGRKPRGRSRRWPAAGRRLPAAAGSWDVLVNAIAGRQRRERAPARCRRAARRRIVFDLVYEPERRAARRRPGGRLLTPSAASTMLIAQAERQFELWTGQRPPAGLFAAAAVGWRQPRATDGQSRPHEANDLRRVRGADAAWHVRAGRQGDHRRPADAGVRVPEDRRALRLRVPVRERRGRRAGRPLLVPRQGSVPGAALAAAARRRSIGRA